MSTDTTKTAIKYSTIKTVSKEEHEKALEKYYGIRSYCQLIEEYYPLVPILYRLGDPIFVENEGFTSMVTYNGKLYIGYKLFMSMDYEHCCVFLVLHEALHILLMHLNPDRYRVFDHSLFNLATDIVIDQFFKPSMVIECFNQYNQIYPNYSCDPNLTMPERYNLPRGEDAIFYYNALLKKNLANLFKLFSKIRVCVCESEEHSHNGDSENQGENNIEGEGSLIPNITLDSPEMKSVIIEVMYNLLEQEKRSRGTVPGGILRPIEEYLRPRMPVDVSSYFHIRELIADQRERSYSRINRRTYNRGDLTIVYPSWIGYKNDVSVIVDTSGSMSDKDLKLAAGVIKRLMDDGLDVVLYSADTQIQSTKQIFSFVGSDSIFNFKGGGGTDMAAVILEVTNKHDPHVVVVITDGYTPWPTKPVNVPVIILLVRKDCIHEVPNWACVYVLSSSGS